jgi:hypothetical protein
MTKDNNKPKRRTVEVKQNTKGGGKVYGATKTVTVRDRKGEVKKVRTKTVGDKDFLQSRREVIARADKQRFKEKNIDQYGIKDKTKEKIVKADIVLTDKEKKRGEPIKTVRSNKNTSTGKVKLMTKTGVRTGEVYKAKSTTKTNKATREASYNKKQEEANKFQGIRTKGFQTIQKNEQTNKKRKNK